MKILDLEISDKTISFKKSVESFFNRPIEILVGEMSIGANETYESSVIENTPRITIKRGEIVNEEILVHEMWHLHMKGISGIYQISFGGHLIQTLLGKFKSDCLMTLLGKAHSIFQHKYFFNRMLEDGYYPSKYLIDAFYKVVEYYPNNIGYDCALLNHVSLDVVQFFNAIEEDDKNANRILNIIKDRNMPAFVLGSKIFKQLDTFSDPLQEPELFSNFLKVLFEYKEPINYSINNNECFFY